MLDDIDQQDQVVVMIEFGDKLAGVADIDVVVDLLLERSDILRESFDAVDALLPVTVFIATVPEFKIFAAEKSELAESDADIKNRLGLGGADDFQNGGDQLRIA